MLMELFKKIAFFEALAQSTVSTPDLQDSSVLFINSKSIWTNNFEQIKALANILNKAVFSASGGRTSLERIKQGTSAVDVLPSGSPQIILDLSKQFVDDIIESPAKSTTADKLQKINKFKTIYDGNKSMIKDISSGDKNKITDILNDMIRRLSAG